MSYAYSPAGDVTQIVNTKTSITYNYTYDLLHRLVAESRNGNYAASEAVLAYTCGTSGAGHIHTPTHVSLNGTGYNFTCDLNGNTTAPR
jgi:YD repeat-containing protein